MGITAISPQSSPVLSVCPKVGTSQACSTIDLAFRCQPRPSITQDSLLREVPELVSHPGQMVRVEAARLGALLTASVLDQAEVARLDTRAGEAPAAPRANGSCRLTLEPLVVACLDDLVTTGARGERKEGQDIHGMVSMKRTCLRGGHGGSRRAQSSAHGCGHGLAAGHLRQCACVCGKCARFPTAARRALLLHP